MTYGIENGDHKMLDQVGWAILRELQQDGRISFAELGRRVGLTPPAVMERIHRMEERGIIRGYHAELDSAKVGLPVMAYIRLNTVGQNHCVPIIQQLVEDTPQIIECHRITGVDCYIMKVLVPDLESLEQVINLFLPYGQTTTSVVMSSVLRQRVIEHTLPENVD